MRRPRIQNITRPIMEPSKPRWSAAAVTTVGGPVVVDVALTTTGGGVPADVVTVVRVEVRVTDSVRVRVTDEVAVAELMTPAAELMTPAAELMTPAAELMTPAAELLTPAASDDAVTIGPGPRATELLVGQAGRTAVVVWVPMVTTISVDACAPTRDRAARRSRTAKVEACILSSVWGEITR